MSSIERLERLLGGEKLVSLRERIRRRFEGKEVVETLQFNGLNAIERDALAQLVGKPPSNAKSMLIDVRTLNETLSAAGIAASLREALELLDGPIIDRAAEREQVRGSWIQLSRSSGHQPLQKWLGKPSNLGLLKRLSRSDTGQASKIVAKAALVLQRLPCSGVPRAQLAAEVLGDAHGLDSGRPVATVVLSVLRADHRFDGPEDEVEDGRARSLWAATGVLVNELAKPALCLNLPFLDKRGRGAETGRPIFFSLRDLVRDPPVWQVDRRTVFICENPNVVAMAADALGISCAPLVCTDGMPAAAQRVLLSQLVGAGAELAYHGDFDWPGIAIASHVMRCFSARPWRMSSQDYELAIGQATERAPLSQVFLDSPWDEGLSQSMKRIGFAVAEEAVFAQMKQDLGMLRLA